MIRQARNYLTGAVSGTALIGAAVVAFVMLVSLQGLRDWPLAALGEGDESGGAAVAPGHPAPSGIGTAVGAGRVANAASVGGGGARGGGAAKKRGSEGSGGGSTRAAAGAPGAGAPGATAPGSSPTTAGGKANSSPPTSSSGGSAASGGGSGGATRSAGSGGNGPGAEGGRSPSPSETVTNTVNNAVNGVDEAGGGTLGGSGVTEVTEGVVERVAGPESAVGQAVGETVETVGGVPGSGH